MKNKYSVAISFNEEQNDLAETIAAFCKIHSLECYYYKKEYAHTTGKVLYEELRKIYQYEPCLVIMLWSENYAKGGFTSTERDLIFERRKAYPESLMLIWADLNPSNPPPQEEGLSYTPWKGNQYGLFKEILERTKKCSDPNKTEHSIKADSIITTSIIGNVNM